jgi:hypothetical protein
MILSGAGRLIWYLGVRGGQEVLNFCTQSYRGEPVLTWWPGETAAGHGHGYDVIDNDRYQTIATVRAANGYTADLHEFQIGPENTVVIPAYQPVRFAAGGFDGVAVDSIVRELDIPTGNLLSGGTPRATSGRGTRPSARRPPVTTTSTSTPSTWTPATTAS